MENENKLTYREAWQRTLRAWKIYWKLCPGRFVSDLLRCLFQAVSPYATIWISAQLINELAGNRDPQQLMKWVLIQLVAGAALSLVGGLLTRWYHFERSNAARLDDRIYMEKMLRMDYADIDRQHVHDLYSQILQNENWGGFGLWMSLDHFGNLIYGVAAVLGGVGLTVSLFLNRVPGGSALAVLNHPLFAVGIVALMLLIAFAGPACTNQSQKYWSVIAEDSRMGNRYFSFFGFMAHQRKRAVDLRMYRQQENICDVYMARDDLTSPDSLRVRLCRGPQGLWLAAGQCVSVVLTGVVYLFVCLKAWGGAFGVGSVTQYVGAITNLFLGISRLLETMGNIRTNAGFLETSYEFLDVPNNMYQGSLTTEKRSDRQYEVEFRDVSFKYPGSDTWALRHVNMKFRVGSRLAVVGMNGSGKTTFIKLLCRLYDPTEGQILLNGIDIRKYRYDDYIGIFSVVFQDFQLFAMPLGENVAGAASYDRERALDCLNKAGFAERMASMPHGLDTMLYKDLDEEGVEVSGGEAQKIAIARALYKDAPFIILDEPTAALDPIAEAEIYSKFNDIAGDKTAIYISHRLSSCKFCDEIAVFHEGSVIQQGTHTDLVADENGKYHELWYAQAQYYTEKTA
ncbi:MAG: ABC transporter ATP-binding protein [Oscillospiraceae bacterium]|nr:ABC transporter ATP-binding protein [Oscillospiraceae bacterium]